MFMRLLAREERAAAKIAQVRVQYDTDIYISRREISAREVRVGRRKCCTSGPPNKMVGKIQDVE